MKTYVFTKDDVAKILADHLECNVGETFKPNDQISLRIEEPLSEPDFTLTVGGSTLLDTKGDPVTSTATDSQMEVVTGKKKK
jgi:hypothetical protein